MYRIAAKHPGRIQRPNKSRAAPGRPPQALVGQIAQNQSLPVAEARAQFADLLNKVAYRKDRIVLTRHGKGIVALIPAEDLEDLEAIEDRIDAELVNEADQDIKLHGTVPLKTVMRQRRSPR